MNAEKLKRARELEIKIRNMSAVIQESKEFYSTRFSNTLPDAVTKFICSDADVAKRVVQQVEGEAKVLLAEYERQFNAL